MHEPTQSPDPQQGEQPDEVDSLRGGAWEEERDHAEHVWRPVCDPTVVSTCDEPQPHHGQAWAPQIEEAVEELQADVGRKEHVGGDAQGLPSCRAGKHELGCAPGGALVCAALLATNRTRS